MIPTILHQEICAPQHGLLGPTQSDPGQGTQHQPVPTYPTSLHSYPEDGDHQASTPKPDNAPTCY